MKIAVLPGDGIGPEITAEAVKVLKALDLKFELETAPVGGAAYEAAGHPLPEATLKLAQDSDAVAEDPATFTVPTKRQPSEEELAELLFAITEPLPGND